VRAVRRPWSNPVVQFLVVSLLLFVVTWYAAGVFSQRAAKTEAIAEARSTTELLAHSVAEPSIPAGLASGHDAGAADRFDRQVGDLLTAAPDVKRIKIWNSAGDVVYSNKPELIGQHFPLDDEQLRALNGGGTQGGLSTLGRQENQFEHEEGGLLEVYTKINAPDGEPLLFEAYYSVATIQDRANQLLTPFRRILAASLAAVLLVGLPLILLLTYRLTRAARARERLMGQAIDASEAERRRIARDLHDGVVQELAGTAFALTATARVNGVPPPAKEDLQHSAMAVRRSLRQLRSLLVEIHPPGLNAAGLAAALEDLTAQTAGDGIETTVTVSGIEGAPDHIVTLLWRVAQEAIRNAVRHAHACKLTVTVTGDERQVRLLVRDDGIGFDPEADGREDSFGLRGLQSLVEDGGGRLQVESAPGAGTTVTMVVERR
jgi:two-component system, NarL family, sensor kinase